MIKPFEGKEKARACLQKMIDDYCREQQMDRKNYATKENNQDDKDNEHYLPFALVELDF